MRKLTVLVAAMAMLIGGTVPAYAGHGDPVDGVWRATDLDGSRMQVTITEHLNDTGFFTVEFIDSRASSACTPATRMYAITTNSLYHDGDKILYADFSDIRCSGNSVPSFSDGFHYEWTVIVDNEIMIDWRGIVWYHVRG